MVCQRCASLLSCSCDRIFSSYQYPRESSVFHTLPTIAPWGVFYPPYEEWYLQSDTNLLQESKRAKLCLSVDAPHPTDPVSKRHVKVDLRNAVYSKDLPSSQTKEPTSQFHIIRGEINHPKFSALSEDSVMMPASSSSLVQPSGSMLESQSIPQSIFKQIQSMTPTDLQALLGLLGTLNTQRSTITTQSTPQL